MKLPITVIILTYNEENNIEDCLLSVHDWADEIIVVDSFSNDRTLEIASRFTSRIYQHPFDNYSRQRNWAQENIPINNEWVFHLDADERVTEELEKSLRKAFSMPALDADGFMVSRRTLFMGKWIRHGGHYPAYHMRIFKAEKGRCEERAYDQHFIIAGKAEILEGDIIDTITDEIYSWIESLNRWSTAEAQEAVQPTIGEQVKAHLKGSPIEKKRWLRRLYYRMPLFIRAIAYFFYRYFLRLGFLDGKEGMIFHFIQGLWYRFLVDAKILELKKNNAMVGEEVEC